MAKRKSGAGGRGGGRVAVAGRGVGKSVGTGKAGRDDSEDEATDQWGSSRGRYEESDEEVFDLSLQRDDEVPPSLTLPPLPPLIPPPS